MPSEPTGAEHLTPQRINSTSATERAGFRKCRRQWFLTQVHRLEGSEGNPNFFLGNLFHWSLEWFYKAKQEGDDHDGATTKGLDAYQSLFDSEMAAMAVSYGPYFWGRAESDWRQTGELGFEMARDYFERERLDPIFDEIIMVELRVSIPIVAPDGRTPLRGELSVKTDLVGRKNGQLGVADHKTAGREPNSAHLDMDDQLTAEVYSTWKHLEEFPELVVYNVAMKRVAEKPRLISKGKKLSIDKSQSTSAELYREAIRDNGFNIMDYIDHVQWLEDQEKTGESRFFSRETTFRTMDQMASFEDSLYWEYTDMLAVAAQPERAYPNPSMMHCPRCPVRDICFTIQDGGDVEAIIKANYLVGEPRR